MAPKKDEGKKGEFGRGGMSEKQKEEARRKGADQPHSGGRPEK